MNHVIHSSYGLHVHKDEFGRYFINHRPVEVAPKNAAAFEDGAFNLGKPITNTQARKRRRRRAA